MEGPFLPFGMTWACHLTHLTPWHNLISIHREQCWMLNDQSEEFLDYQLGHSLDVVIVGMQPLGWDNIEDGPLLLCILQSKDSPRPNAQHIVGALEVSIGERRKGEMKRGEGINTWIIKWIKRRPPNAQVKEELQTSLSSNFEQCDNGCANKNE